MINDNQPRAYTTIAQPVIALQWDGSVECAAALCEFLGPTLFTIHDRGTVVIYAGGPCSLTVRGEIDDWVIKQPNGIFAIVPRAVFDDLYVEVPRGTGAAEPQHVPDEPPDEQPVDPTLADA